MKTIHVDATASTNDLAWEVLQTEQAPVLIVADRQTAGRGRGTNDWSSPDGNLYLSLGLDVRTSRLQNISVRIAIHLCRMLNRHLAGGELRIKWPNDLMLDDGKAAGILVESRVRGNRARLVAGVGINIRHAPVPKSAALHDLLKPGRDSIISMVTESIRKAVDDQAPDLPQHLLDLSWFNPGETVTYAAGNKSFNAVFTGYDCDLALCVETGDGIISLNGSLVSRIRPKPENEGDPFHGS